MRIAVAAMPSCQRMALDRITRRMTTRSHDRLIRASAPGSLMLFGEHAVLHGHPALAAAIDRRITVQLRPRADDQVCVTSAIGRYATRRGTIADDPRFRFVVETLRAFDTALPAGCELDLESDFSPELGLGSSAAVTVALLGALDAWCGTDLDRPALHARALGVIRAVQGRGSGADAAASLYGGVVRIADDPPVITPIAGCPPLTVVYSGSKRKTAEVIACVDQLARAHPTVVQAVFEAMGAVTEQATAALAAGDWPALGRLADTAEGLMAALALETPAIREILTLLQRDPGIHGAKISGSGLGDCVIGFGRSACSCAPFTPVDAAITAEGLTVTTDAAGEVRAATPPIRPMKTAAPSQAASSATPRDVVMRLIGDRPPGPSGNRSVAEAFAPANIALVKYWGKRDTDLNLPVTNSLSLSLPGERGSRVRLSFRDGSDRISLNGATVPPDSAFARRLSAWLDLFRANPDIGYAVEAVNTIPTAAGFASSASGFAALTKALDALHGWGLPLSELSILARLGSGSACRSLFDGLVEWHAGRLLDGMDSYAEPLTDQWPELRIGLLIVSDAAKAVGSREAMRRTVETSPLYRAWPETVTQDLATIKAAIRARDFECLGRTVEGNALAMHATMLAARPAVCYWQPESLARMEQVRRARADGLPVYFTMDAGPNLKLLHLASDTDAVAAAFPGLGRPVTSCRQQRPPALHATP